MDERYSDGLGCTQGVILSPLMFDIEFNDVLACVEQVRYPGAGIEIGNGRRILNQKFGQLFADERKRPLYSKDTERDTETVLMHGTLVRGAEINLVTVTHETEMHSRMLKLQACNTRNDTGETDSAMLRGL